MLFRSKKALAFLVLISISMAACPATGIINNFLADSVTFTTNAGSSVALQTYNYQFQSKFDKQPAAAIAIQSFTLNLVGPNNFAIKPNVSTTGAQFVFSYTPTVWSSIKVNFWISDNSQIQVGNFEVANLQTGTGNCEGCALVNTNIATPFGQTDNPVIRVFLNGFFLDNRSGALQVSVAPTDLRATNLTIKVTMGTLTILNSITLSWIAFSPTTSSFASYGGQVSQSKF